MSSQYSLTNYSKKDCDAAKYGLYHGKDYEEWFETYLEIYENDGLEEVKENDR
jgi:hypothetical protein